MGGGADKLFFEAAGEPIIAHTWRRFDRSPCIHEVVVVIRNGRESEFQEVANQIQTTKPFRLVHGGSERQDSVWNGLVATDETASLVAVHDGVRPCVSGGVIEDCFEVARRTDASAAAAKVADTLKEAHRDQTIRRNVDRSLLWSVQTPQVFRRDVIVRAMQAVREVGAQVTDDTAACELIGQAVTLVESDAPNPKVTVKADLPFVEWLLAR